MAGELVRQMVGPLDVFLLPSEGGQPYQGLQHQSSIILSREREPARPCNR
jgi:hypothetical protein